MLIGAESERPYERLAVRGGGEWLRSHGVEVTDLDSQECADLLGGFIAERLEVWNEDIGV